MVLSFQVFDWRAVACNVVPAPPPWRTGAPAMSTTRFRTVKAPHGTLVHFDYLNVERVDETVRATSCGRKVPTTWTSAAVSGVTAVEQTTCPRCRQWAQYHVERETVDAQLDTRLGAGWKNQPHRYLPAADLRAAQELLARLEAADQPAAILPTIAVIEQTHSWGDCVKVTSADGHRHCHCSLEVAAIRAGEPRTCRHCGQVEHPAPVLEDEAPAGTPCSRCGRDAADPVHGDRFGHAFDVEPEWDTEDPTALQSGETVDQWAIRVYGEDDAAECVCDSSIVDGHLESCPAQLEQDHADALVENVMHDAATAVAQPLETYLAAVAPPRLPRAVRYGAALRVVVPQ